MKTIKSKNFLLRAATILGLAVFIIPGLATAQQGIHRTELQRHDLSIAGHEAIQVIVAFDSGTVAGKHAHPGEEIIYVTEGVIEYEVDGKPPVTLKAGDVLFIPAGTFHSAKNKSSKTGAELATYIVEKGKPILTWKK